MPTTEGYDKKALRWLRNRTVIVWTSIITIGFLLLTLLTNVIVYIYHWYTSTDYQQFAHFVFFISSLFFGLASSFGFILSIWILGQINPERFTTSQELLRHCIDLFDDANKSNSSVNLLTLFPNPGQFDEFFNLAGRRHNFSELKEKISACLSNPAVDINLVCLGGDPKDSSSDLYKFLEKYYASEVGSVSTQRLDRLGGLSGYAGAVYEYMQSCLVNGEDAGLKFEYIHKDWLSEMEKGEPIVVLGYSNIEAFLGTISFKGPTYSFAALDFKGDVGAMRILFNSMKRLYTSEPPDYSGQRPDTLLQDTNA